MKQWKRKKDENKKKLKERQKTKDETMLRVSKSIRKYLYVIIHRYVSKDVDSYFFTNEDSGITVSVLYFICIDLYQILAYCTNIIVSAKFISLEGISWIFHPVHSHYNLFKGENQK